MSTRKTSVAIDDELLDEARRILETRTIKDTIEASLREVVRADARRREVQALGGMQGLDLADQDVMAGAWRN